MLVKSAWSDIWFRDRRHRPAESSLRPCSLWFTVSDWTLSGNNAQQRYASKRRQPEIYSKARNHCPKCNPTAQSSSNRLEASSIFPEKRVSSAGPNPGNRLTTRHRAPSAPHERRRGSRRIRRAKRRWREGRRTIRAAGLYVYQHEDWEEAKDTDRRRRERRRGSEG